jgi:acyl-CoA thioesterase II
MFLLMFFPSIILNAEIISIFRGSDLWRPFEGRAVFGGQVIGQALVAANKTKLPDYHIHSLHCYFVRPGETKLFFASTLNVN